MKSFLRNFIFLFIFSALFTNNSWSYTTGEVIQKDLAFDSDIASQIENAFLFSNQEQDAIKNNIRNFSSNNEQPDYEALNSRVKFKASRSKNRLNLDKKMQEKVAYNSYINGQYEIALKMYKELTTRYHSDAYSRYCLALTYQKLRQFKEAKKIYFDLLKLNPKNKEEITANLITILSEENPNKALFLLTKLANQNPNSGYFLAQRALILEKMGRYTNAIDEMKKASIIEPSRADYKLNLAIIYDKNKNFSEALAQYQNTLKNHSEHGKETANIPVQQILSRIDVVKTLI